MKVSLFSRVERFVRVFCLNISAETEIYLRPYFFPSFLSQGATVYWLFNLKCLKCMLSLCLQQGPCVLVHPGKVHKCAEKGQHLKKVGKCLV